MSALNVGECDASLDASLTAALNSIRNFVRKQFRIHDIEEIEVEAIWPTGEIQTLTFDRNVGYPKEIKRQQWEESLESEVTQW